MKTYNLGWGNSVAVRSAFLEHALTQGPIVFGLKELESMDYPPHEGDAALIEVTRRTIERQVGPTFNHIILTNGAAGGCTLALRAYKKKGYNTAFTRSSPYFPIYPAMIESAGLKHVTEGDDRNEGDRPVALLDSPTNPHGTIVSDGGGLNIPTIWDAVYHSRVYTSGNYKPITCEAIVGSYSKLLGLNGLRTGWIATNDPLLYERLKSLVTAEYCGLSSASTTILLRLLSQYQDNNWWAGFEHLARRNLNDNRSEWSKVEKFFGGMSTSPNGMFYYSYMDKACKKLMAKSNIIWTVGSACGHNDDFGRFNLGQDVNMIRDAVKDILKNDTRKKRAQ
jgi:aspartate/methionine/tyrosine aminotransferase